MNIKLILSCFFLATLLSSCDLLSPFPREVKIRVLNNSDYDFKNLRINGVEYGNLDKYEFSGYGSFLKAYRYGEIYFEIDDKPFRQNPNDFSGETPLDGGTYTYMLSVDVKSGSPYLTFFKGNDVPSDPQPDNVSRIVETTTEYRNVSGIEVSTGGFILRATRVQTTIVNPTVSQIPGSKVRYLRMARAGQFEQEFLLIRTDEQGNQLWTKSFSIEEPTFNRMRLNEANDGGFVITGTIQLPRSDSFFSLSNPFVLKTDALGNTLWYRHYALDSNTEVFDIVNNGDGGFVLGGLKDRTWLMNIDSQGNEVWQAHLGQPRHRGESVIKTSDGYVVAGESRGLSNSGLTKTDNLGNAVWTSSLNYKFRSVIQTSDQSFVVAGVTPDFNDAVLVKYDADGTLQWRRELRGNQMQYTHRAFSVAESPDSTLAISGQVSDNHALFITSKDGLLVKTHVLDQLIDGSSSNSIVRTSDDHFMLMGSSERGILFAKFDLAGNLLFISEIGD